MRFGEALDVMERGGAVARPGMIRRGECVHLLSDRSALLRQSGAQARRWMPVLADLLAGDWREVVLPVGSAVPVAEVTGPMGEAVARPEKKAPPKKKAAKVVARG